MGALAYIAKGIGDICCYMIRSYEKLLSHTSGLYVSIIGVFVLEREYSTKELEFCYCCNSYVGPNEGLIRLNEEAEAVVICPECLRIEQKKTVLPAHDANNGSLNDI